MIKKKRSGISKPIICSRCNKVVGYVKPKLAFNIQLLFWGFIIALITQIIAEYLVQIILGY